MASRRCSFLRLRRVLAGYTEMTLSVIKAGFYVYRYWPKPAEDKQEAGMILMAGPFIEWQDAEAHVPKCMAYANKVLPRPDARFAVCRMESAILPAGIANAALWVSKAALVS